MSVTVERLGSTIQRELVGIVNLYIQDLEIGHISITEVRVTKDLSFATIFYSILSENEEVISKTNTKIEDNKVMIRKDLAKKIKSIRKIPELIFKYDTTLTYGNKIDRVLNSL